MRFLADDEVMKQVQAILVTCPHCKYRKPVNLDYFLELDTEEGWVEVLQPALPTQQLTVEEVDPKTDEPEDTGEVGFNVLRLEGKVEVLYRKKDE